MGKPGDAAGARLQGAQNVVNLVLAIVGLQLGVRHHRRPHSGIGGIGVASGIGGVNGASAAGGGGATISLENGATQ